MDTCRQAKKGKRAPFFVTEDPDCPAATAGKSIRQGQADAFMEFADAENVLAGSRDYDLEVTRLTQRSGLRKGEVEKGIYGYQSLRRLPGLRAIQKEHWRLDVDRLDAIARAIAALGCEAPAEAYEAFDDVLVDIFTPTRARQPLPTSNTITLRLNKMIAEFDNAAAFDPERRKKRKKGPPSTNDLDFGPGAAGADTAWMTLNADNATIAAVRASIEATARELGTTQANALVKLATGDVTPAAMATIYAYAPKNADGEVDQEAAAFIPGFGHTGPNSTALLHHFAATYGTTEVDLDVASKKVVAGHDAPADVAAYVRGRDGTCVYPGCTRPAQACQLDHRQPYDEGGMTTADNLFCLCQHHHNLKTDRRAFYVPDPVTGSIVWLLEDGTYYWTDPNGLLAAYTTPTAPRWRRSVDDVERLRQQTEHFLAKSHAVLDAYETTAQAYDPYIPEEQTAAWDLYKQCKADLQDLEEEFDEIFHYHPLPPKAVPDDELVVPDNQFFNTYDGTGRDADFDPDDPHSYCDEEYDIHAFFRPAGYPFSTAEE